jgi:hypothetical protein
MPHTSFQPGRIAVSLGTLVLCPFVEAMCPVDTRPP